MTNEERYSFLRDFRQQNSHDEWIDYLHNQHFNNVPDFINGGFIWNESENGEEYWISVHRKYVEEECSVQRAIIESVRKKKRWHLTPFTLE
jgi:hypothetical protein